MYKLLKKSVLLTAALYLLLPTLGLAQAKFTPGPTLESDKNNNMNRMLGGDNNSFYCYRIRSKGRGTSFFVEKYSKSTMKLEFSKEVSLGDKEDETTIEDVEYAAGNVYIFRRVYDKKADKMTLFFQTVSSSGEVSKDLKEVIAVSSDHYEFVDFEIFPNPSKTKLLVKAAHKADKKDSYKADLIIIDAVNIKKQNTRRVNNNLHIYNVGRFFAMMGVTEEESSSVIGMYLADNDDIFYCLNEGSAKEGGRMLNLYTLKANEDKPKMLNLPFDDAYFVGDIEFSLAADKDVVIGGFLSDVIERKGRDLVKRGIFSFKVNATNNSIVGKTTYFFEDKMLQALESTPKKARYDNYKLDYIIPVGDATYYVGELYRLAIVTTYNSNGGSSTTYNYDYMDVIVAKLNSKGVFEWIVNSPLRNDMSLKFQHVFKQYIAYATDKNLYILNNDHPKNMARYEKSDFEPRDLKSVGGIHGSNFVSNAIDLKTGKISRQLVFENEDFCFAPIQERNPQFIPPSDCEIFTPGNKGEIFIYTEDRGVDRFGRIKFD